MHIIIYLVSYVRVVCFVGQDNRVISDKCVGVKHIIGRLYLILWLNRLSYAKSVYLKQVDVLYADIEKAFDKVRYIISKIISYIISKIISS